MKQLAAGLLVALLTLAGTPAAFAQAPARFVDQGDGTVLDTSTGIVWLQNPSALPPAGWDAATNLAAALADGQQALTDGSRAGHWRLPTNDEWKTMVPGGRHDPSASIFRVDWDQRYWSSTTPDNDYGAYHLGAWGDGGIDFDSRSTPRHIWPVRDGAPAAPPHGGGETQGPRNLDRVQGTWQVEGEPGKILEIEGDRLRTWDDGELRSDGTIAFAPSCEGHEADPEERYFTVAETSGTGCYFLNKAEEKALEIFSVDSGETLSFERFDFSHGGDDEPNIEGHLAQMQGRWQSVDDPARVVEIMGNQITAWNDGEHRGDGTIAFVSSCDGREDDPEERYFILTEESDAECFFLNRADAEAFEILSVSEDITLLFNRIE